MPTIFDDITESDWKAPKGSIFDEIQPEEWMPEPSVGRFAKKTAYAVRQGAGDILSGFAAGTENAQRQAEKFGLGLREEVRRINPAAVSKERVPAFSADKAISGLQATAKAMEIPDELQQPTSSKVYNFIEDAATGLAGSAPAMIATAVNPPAGIAMMYEQILGGGYNKRIQEGADPDRAYIASALDAMAQAPLEYAGTVFELGALKKMAGGKAINYLKTVLRTAAAEGLEEGLQAIPGKIADIYAANPGKSNKELADIAVKELASVKFAKEAGYQAATGALGGLFVGMAGGAYNAAKSRFRKNDIETTQESPKLDKEQILNGLVSGQITIDDIQEVKASYPDLSGIIDEAVNDFQSGRPNAPEITIPSKEEVTNLRQAPRSTVPRGEGAETIFDRIEKEQQEGLLDRDFTPLKRPTRYSQGEIDPIQLQRELERDKLRDTPEDRAIAERNRRRALVDPQKIERDKIEAQRQLKEADRYGIELPPQVRSWLEQQAAMEIPSQIQEQTGTERQPVDYGEMKRTGQWSEPTEIQNAESARGSLEESRPIPGPQRETEEAPRRVERGSAEQTGLRGIETQGLEAGKRDELENLGVPLTEAQAPTQEPSGPSPAAPTQQVAEQFNTQNPGNAIKYDGIQDRSAINKPPLYSFTAYEGPLKGASFNLENPTAESIKSKVDELIGLRDNLRSKTEERNVLRQKAIDEGIPQADIEQAEATGIRDRQAERTDAGIQAGPEGRQAAGPQTLRGRIKQAGGINFLNFKGEYKNLPIDSKFLSNKKGIPIDVLEETLKSEGWLSENDSLLDLLTDPQNLKRGRAVSTGAEAKTAAQRAQEAKLERESIYEPEGPPEGDYVTMKAGDLPEGKKLTIIEGNSRDGWDEYEVVDSDPFSVTLKDGTTLELASTDEVQVRVDDLPGNDFDSLSQKGKKAVKDAIDDTSQMTYSKAVQRNLEHMGTPSNEWSAVPIESMNEVEGDKGNTVLMPSFNFPQGYTSGPSLYKSGSSQNPNCEWCGTNIKKIFWIQNDAKKWTLMVGSECITHFGEGKSGERLAKEQVWEQNRDLLRKAEQAKYELRKVFYKNISLGYGRWDIGLINHGKLALDADETWRELKKVIGTMQADPTRSDFDNSSTNAGISRWVKRHERSKKISTLIDKAYDLIWNQTHEKPNFEKTYFQIAGAQAKPIKNAQQQEIIKEEPQLFESQEKANKPKKIKKEASKSDQEQNQLFGYNQTDMFGSKTEIGSIAKKLKSQTGSSQLATDIINQGIKIKQKLKQKGIESFRMFHREMRARFKDVWEKIKGHMRALWGILSNERGQVDVYHGSPHRFEKFSAERVGIGEGAQSFGWGLYFTDQKEIAEHYAKTKPQVNPSPRRTFLGKEISDTRSPEYHAASLMKQGQSLARTRFEVETWIEDAKQGEDVEHYKKVLDVLNRAESKKDFGELPPFEGVYKATLHEGKDPSDYSWLDWDKKIADKELLDKIINMAEGKQSVWPGISLPNAIRQNIKEYEDVLTGARFYRELSNALGSDKEASLFLQRAGIDGIRYPAGTLSGGGKGTNYVVFDENAVTIKEINGQLLDALKNEKGSSELVNDIISFGTQQVQNGVKSFSDFTAAMKERFSAVWEKIKNHMRQLWNTLNNQRGAITLERRTTKSRADEILAKLNEPSPTTQEQLSEKQTTEPEKAEETDLSSYEKVKDIWFGDKDLRILQNKVENKKLQESIKTALGIKRYGLKGRVMDSAIQIYIDLKRNPEHLKKYYDSLTKEQKTIVDLSQNLPDEIKKIADKISDSYKKIGLEALDAGVIRNVLDNYAARIWEIKGRPSSEALRKFGTKTRHAKQRTFETILEGWSNGYILKVNGATNNLNILKDEIVKTIQDKKFLSTLMDLTDIDGNPLVTTKQLDGYEEIKHPNFVKWEPVGKAQEKPTGEVKWYGKNSFADETGTVWERKSIYAPKKISKNLNNILGTSSLNNIPGVHLVTKYNAIMKSWILQSSFFHHLAFMRSYYLGTSHKTWAEMNIRRAYKEGYDNVLNMAPIVKLGVKNGLTIGVSQDWSESLLQEKTIIGKILDKTSATKAIKDKILLLREMQADFLFSKFGAGLKAKAFEIEYRNQMKRYPGSDPDVVAKRVANLINDDFGGLHLGRIGRNPTTQHIFRIFALAPDWTESNIRTMVKSIKSGTKEETDLYRRFWAGILIKGIGATVLANFLLAGGDPDEFEKKYKKAWRAGHFRWLDIDITPIYKALGGETKEHKYFSILGHFKDPSKFITHPIRSAHHKGSVVYKTVHEALTGTNWAGQKYTTLSELMEGQPLTKYGSASPIGYSQIPSYVISQIIGAQPVQIQNAIRWANGEMEGFDAIANSMGLGTATTYSPKNKLDVSGMADKNAAELESLGISFNLPHRKVKIGKTEIELDEDAYRKIADKFSAELSERFERLMNRDVWQKMSEERKIDELRGIRKRVGKKYSYYLRREAARKRKKTSPEGNKQ